MADAYARATGKVGVASTTCGPGFTQIMTGLAIAARANTPMVVFAGDSPIAAPYYIQQIDMAPLTQATGAHHISVKTMDRALENVREAFHFAALERRPVVISIPMDLQKQAYPHMVDYIPSADYLPAAQRPQPDPVLVEKLVELIAASEKPIIIAGRGAKLSQAREAIEEMAEAMGALLTTSLQAKGLFTGNRFAMDISGAYASDFSRERFAEADLVIGLGVGLGAYTTESGYLYPGAQTVQIDIGPRGLWQGLRTADLHIRADAKAAAEAVTAAIKRHGAGGKRFRSDELAALIAADVPDRKEFTIAPGTVDPRKAMLIEGDGSLLMHIQELETARRHGTKFLMAIINDGGYGAEIHKFRAGNIDAGIVIHGRGDLAGVANGFGVRGQTVSALGQMGAMFETHQSGNSASLWDVHTDDTVVSRPYRRIHYGEA